MPSSIHFLFGITVALLIFGRSTEAFNPCMIDQNACMPLDDFEVNCTCVLLHGKIINVTDHVYLYFLGHEIPFKYFKQVRMPKIFREKLDIRIPRKEDYNPALEMPETIYKNMRIEESMALFMAGSNYTDIFLSAMINESFIRTEQLRNNSQAWCNEGECSAFVFDTYTYNKTIGIYAYTVDLLHVIEMGGKSIYAVSSVYGEFNVPRVHTLLCETKCQKYYWNERILCQQRCTAGMRYDKVAVTGQLKRDFEQFIKGAAIYNFREKYYKFLKAYPR